MTTGYQSRHRPEYYTRTLPPRCLFAMQSRPKEKILKHNPQRQCRLVSHTENWLSIGSPRLETPCRSTCIAQLLEEIITRPPPTGWDVPLVVGDGGEYAKLCV